MESAIKNILLFFAVFCMAVNPAANSGDSVIFRYPDLWCSGVFILIAFWSKLEENPRQILGVSFFSMIYLLMMLVGTSAVFNYEDRYGYILLIRSTITIVASYGFVVLLWKWKRANSVQVLFQLLTVCCVIQGIALWSSYLSDSVREVFSIAFYRDNVGENQHLIELRVPGFVSTGGDGLSLCHGILCLAAGLGIFLNSYKSWLKYALSFIVIASAVGNAFTGRSGFYLSIGFIPLVLIAFNKGCLRVTVKILLIPVLIGVVFFAIYIGSDLLGDVGLMYRNEAGYEHPIARLLIGFVDLKQYGTYKDETVESLLIHQVILPDSLGKIIFGSSNFGQSTVDTISSDVGYIRMLHGFGIIGLSIFMYAFVLKPLVTVLNAFRRLQLLFSYVPENLVKLWYLVQICFVLSFYGVCGHWKIPFLNSRVFQFIFYSSVFLALKSILYYSERKTSLNMGGERNSEVVL